MCVPVSLPLVLALILALNESAGTGGDGCMGIGFNICIACEKIAQCFGVRVEDAGEGEGRFSPGVGAGIGVVGMGVAVDDADTLL